MKIQVNSDNTIEMGTKLMLFVEGEVGRVLRRHAKRLTRVEVHLSDVDNKKTGQADKRCLIEARPAGARPLSASAKATKIQYAVDEALVKMQRSLSTSFGRRDRPIAAVSKAVSKVTKATAKMPDAT
jgi:ribosomal subunit interface protein